MSVLVEQVPFWLVLPLRQRVLRPHQRIAEVRFDGDEVGTHFAAFDDEGDLVGIASLIPEATAEQSSFFWRLRGMAISPEHQREGIGRLIMTAILDFVPRAGGGGIWCAARVPAIGFYEQFGFVVAGEVYEEAIIGPHVRMELRAPGRNDTEQSEERAAPE
jgi:predicted GNAT family N-acyltransferase